MDDVTRRRPAVRFGEFELDHWGELRSGARKIKLQEQPSQILRILLERAGEIVTREELRQKIWPSDTFVDFDHGINNAIKRLREAISKSQEEREVSLRFGGLGSRSGDASSYRRNVPQVQIRKNP